MLVSYSDFAKFYSMKVHRSKRLILAVSLVFFGAIASLTGIAQQPPVKSQEISEIDGQPVLVKHLPDYDLVRNDAVFLTDKAAVVGQIAGEAVLEVLEFPVGTEAVIAGYPQGRLLIVEYMNPQLSVEVDSKVQQFLGANPNPQLAYRRIGNYNAFVFGTSDQVLAGELLDQVKYEKTVQWLGDDPYLLQRLEKYLVTNTRDIMVSTVLWIGLILGTATVTGIAVGFVFFRIRDQRRAHSAAFSDAGGLTRLNLDDLSE